MKVGLAIDGGDGINTKGWWAPCCIVSSNSWISKHLWFLKVAHQELCLTSEFVTAYGYVTTPDGNGSWGAGYGRKRIGCKSWELREFE